MSFHLTIAEHLETLATDAEAPVATQLRATAKKLGSYSRAPGTRAQAERISTILTPAAVEAMGTALLANLQDDATDERPGVTPEVVQTGYATCGLLIASSDEDLSAAALNVLDRLDALFPTLLPRQVESVQFYSGLFPESPAASQLFQAAATRLGQEPETDAARWARTLGLDLPDTYWSLVVVVPGSVEGGRPDVDIMVYLWHYPGDHELSRWEVKVGTGNGHSLGASAGQKPALSGWEHGEYDRTGRRGPTIAGTIAPVEDLRDLPRVIADLERAHPELTYDRTAITTSGGPGRLITPTKKKKLVAWLHGDS